MSKATNLLKNIISTNKVVVFSKTYCPHCTASKDLFKKIYPSFKAVELDQEKDGDEIHQELKNTTQHRTVPNIWVNQKFIGGNDTIQQLYKNGELKKMLE
ncbi:glutaredoxin [Acrasis kona]|uniref:Glutaredoxin n=1 Tax=Acrasis kona TaxID=1008807 RepID=A0AAW2ZC94_9EUKA